MNARSSLLNCRQGAVNNYHCRRSRSVSSGSIRIEAGQGFRDEGDLSVTFEDSPNVECDNSVGINRYIEVGIKA